MFGLFIDVSLPDFLTTMIVFFKMRKNSQEPAIKLFLFKWKMPMIGTIETDIYYFLCFRQQNLF